MPLGTGPVAPPSRNLLLRLVLARSVSDTAAMPLAGTFAAPGQPSARFATGNRAFWPDLAGAQRCCPANASRAKRPRRSLDLARSGETGAHVGDLIPTDAGWGSTLNSDLQPRSEPQPRRPGMRPSPQRGRRSVAQGEAQRTPGLVYQVNNPPKGAAEPNENEPRNSAPLPGLR